MRLKPGKKKQCSFSQSEIQVLEINTSKQCHTMQVENFEHTLNTDKKSEQNPPTLHLFTLFTLQKIP